MPELVDLHIHTNHSDGLQTPEDVINSGMRLGLKAISITDHDVVSGVIEAASYAEGKDIEVVSGIELSVSKAKDDIHLLGYFIDTLHEELVETLERFRRIRQERGRKMVERLAAIGVNIDYSKILASAGKAAIGRPHLAEALLNGGYVSNYNESFRKYLGLHGPVYVPKAKISPAEAISLLHRAGGIAVMAHPGLTNEDNMIEEMAAAGLDGIEIFHPTHNGTDRKRYRRLAEKLGLVCTGGSDSHNRKGRYGDIGDQKVPADYLAMMKNAWHERQKH
ncbi:MAG: PHP domain-containing protein [candidate division Zixibacteria bacterium]|nr:PHP domain-containing protein [candidate division Zixibacteria bacterium]